MFRFHYLPIGTSVVQLWLTNFSCQGKNKCWKHWLFFASIRLQVSFKSSIQMEVWITEYIDLDGNGLEGYTIYWLLRGKRLNRGLLTPKQIRTSWSQKIVIMMDRQPACPPTCATLFSELPAVLECSTFLYVVSDCHACRSGTNPKAFRIFRPASGEAPRFNLAPNRSCWFLTKIRPFFLSSICLTLFIHFFFPHAYSKL